MSAAENRIEQLLATVAAGRLDALSAEQLAELERALASDARLAARVGTVRPAADARLRATVPLPTPAQWSETWDAIDSRTAAGARRTAAAGLRILRLWQGLAAAAACLLVVWMWRMQSPPSTGYAIELTTSVQVDELEVFGDATAVVVAPSDEMPYPVISVVMNGGA